MIYNRPRRQEKSKSITVTVTDALNALKNLLTGKGALTFGGTAVTAASTALSVKSPAKVVYTLTGDLSKGRKVYINDAMIGTVSASGDTVETTLDVDDGDTVAVKFTGLVENSKTWKLKATIDVSTNKTWSVSFTTKLSSREYFSLEIKTRALIGRYMLSSSTQGNDAFYEYTAWNSESYRTITFTELPTGDLLTWLQANATPQ